MKVSIEYHIKSGSYGVYNGIKFIVTCAWSRRPTRLIILWWENVFIIINVVVVFDLRQMKIEINLKYTATANDNTALKCHSLALFSTLTHTNAPQQFIGTKWQKLKLCPHLSSQLSTMVRMCYVNIKSNQERCVWTQSRAKLCNQCRISKSFSLLLPLLLLLLFICHSHRYSILYAIFCRWLCVWLRKV